MGDPLTGPGTPDEAADPGPISLTTAFELLARGPRRHLLYWLHHHDDRLVSLDVLARRLTERGGDDAGGLRETRTALHHVHLPKLAAADIVEYDPDDKEIRYVGDPRLGELLEWSRHEERWD